MQRKSEEVKRRLQLYSIYRLRRQGLFINVYSDCWSATATRIVTAESRSDPLFQIFGPQLIMKVCILQTTHVDDCGVGTNAVSSLLPIPARVDRNMYI